MSEDQRVNRFVRLLRRLRSLGPRTKADDAAIRTIAHAHSQREEMEIRKNAEPHDINQFCREIEIFPDSESGLESFGWRELPAGGGPVIEAGATGRITLAYKYTETGVPLERRHLCVAKFQHGHDFRSAWREAEVLSGIVHENVVDYFGMFAVEPDHIWLLLEYANAGDMRKEVSRFRMQHVQPDPHVAGSSQQMHRGSGIPETGCRYYGRQIASGLRYVHSKGVIHMDLHMRNILLKYNHDGSKTCMICDFGECYFLLDSDMVNGHHGDFRFDIASLCLIILNMIGDDTPASMDQIHHIAYPDVGPSTSAPSSVEKLLQLDWFHGPAIAPIPKTPTPLLTSEVVDKIGFLPQSHPTGADAPHVQGKSVREKDPSLWRRAGKSLSSLKDRVTHRFKSRGSAEPAASPEAGASGLASRSGRDSAHEVTHVSPSAQAEDEGWASAPADGRDRSIKVPKMLRRMLRKKSPK